MEVGQKYTSSPHPWDNIEDSQVEAWNKVTSAKLWARIFRGKYEQNSLATVDKTCNVIRSLVEVKSEVALGVLFLVQKWQLDGECFPTPYHMLISGLTKEQASYLSRLEVVCTQEITLLFKPFEDQHLSFIAKICSFTFRNSEEVHPVVMDIIKKHYNELKEIIAHVMESAPIPLDCAMLQILESISIKYIEVKRSPMSRGDFQGWNIYLNNSCLSDDDHIELIKLMRARKYPTATTGYGISLQGKDTLFCVNCKSINHDTPNCPFPNIPG